MADGLLTSILGAIDRQKQATKAGLGLLVSDPMEFARSATARYFPTPEEVAQQRALEQSSGMAMNTPYMDKMFNLAQFQGSIKAPKGGAGLENFLESSKVKERLYHATPYDFSEFKPGGDNPQRSGPAIWMSPNKEFQPAAHNIRQIPDKPGYMYGSSSNMFTPGTNVMPLYANIKNPLIATEQNWKEMFKDTGGDPWMMPQKTVDILKKRGYDGVFYLNKNGSLEEVIAFDPSQVKSAIGNRGTYDIKNPNILAAGVPLGLLAGTEVEMPKRQQKKQKNK